MRPHGTMWCVGTGNNLGRWLGSAWEDRGAQVLSLAFDTQGSIWCVGKKNNVGQWDGSGWDRRGQLADWELLRYQRCPRADASATARRRQSASTPR